MKTTPEQYFAKQQDHQHNLKVFARFLESEHTWNDKVLTCKPKTIRSYIGACVSYLSANDIELPRKFWKCLGVRNVAITNDRIPTREELRSILSHCDEIGKALFLLEASSGVRIEDALELKLETVRKVLSEHPPMLTVIQRKTQIKQLVFFSQETVQAIREWLKVRTGYLIMSHKFCVQRGIGHVDIDSDRLFPFLYGKAHTMWDEACNSAGLIEKDENTGRRVLHIHSLRKYFRTNVGRAGLDSDVCEALTGHQSGLERIYARYTQDEIKRLYLKAEPELRVFVEAVPDSQSREEITKLKEKLEAQRKLIQDLNEGMRNLALTHQDPEVRKLWEGELAQ